MGNVGNAIRQFPGQLNQSIEEQSK